MSQSAQRLLSGSLSRARSFCSFLSVRSALAILFGKSKRARGRARSDELGADGVEKNNRRVSKLAKKLLEEKKEDEAEKLDARVSTPKQLREVLEDVLIPMCAVRGFEFERKRYYFSGDTEQSESESRVHSAGDPSRWLATPGAKSLCESRKFESFFLLQTCNK